MVGGRNIPLGEWGEVGIGEVGAVDVWRRRGWRIGAWRRMEVVESGDQDW